MKCGFSQKRTFSFYLGSTLSSAAINHLAGHSEAREKNKDHPKSESAKIKALLGV